MKTALWIILGILVVVGLVLAGLTAGWVLWGQRLWAAGPPIYATGRGPALGDDYCGDWGYGGAGQMMGRRGAAALEECPTWGDEAPTDRGPVSPTDFTIEEAHEAVEAYVAAEGYRDLEVAEVMEFERNFYAIVREHETGIGAMELLVDKRTGAVGPEMGPNMMWNVRYGMHGGEGMMESGSETNAILPEEAVEIAQRWLDENQSGISVDEHAVSFYGYYTIHTLQNGDVEGMLSVHGTTGQVWYHSWHGLFVQMVGEQDHR
jgi:hypothetical protein